MRTCNWQGISRGILAQVPIKGTGVMLTEWTARIAVTSLQNAGALTICNKWCETTPEWDDAEAQALDVDLPSLETAGQLSLVGNISSISAPQLQTVTSAGLFLNIMSQIPVALSFPRLHPTGSLIKIAGDVANLDLPMLRNLTSSMIFTSWQPIHFKLAAESLFRVELEGRFQSIELPNLITYDAIKVKAQGLFDCAGLEQQLRRQTGPKSDEWAFECSAPYTPTPRPKGPSYEAKAFLVFSGFALVTLGVFLARRHRRQAESDACKFRSNKRAGVLWESGVSQDRGLLSRASVDQESVSDSGIPLPPYSASPPSGSEH
ncbi:hypothetical protein BDW69DRAFT_128582 [Aspergillus filifer]